MNTATIALWIAVIALAVNVGTAVYVLYRTVGSTTVTDRLRRLEESAATQATRVGHLHDGMTAVGTQLRDHTTDYTHMRRELDVVQMHVGLRDGG